MSCLFVDRREDDANRSTRRSEDLGRYVVPASAVEVVELTAADVAFVGQGPGGFSTSIGVEIKTVADVIQSIQTNRFTGHQLPLLVEHYHMVWLLIEGQWRPSKDGHIEVFRPPAEPRSRTLRPAGRKAAAASKGRWSPLTHGRPMLWRELRNWLTTMEVCGGIRIAQTRDRDETARWCAALWWWWGKDFEDHKSHLALKADPFVGPLRRATLTEKVALQLPGLGQTRARAAGATFASPYDLITADEAAWRKVPGVGKTTASNLVDVVRRKSRIITKGE